MWHARLIPSPPKPLTTPTPTAAAAVAAGADGTTVQQQANSSASSKRAPPASLYGMVAALVAHGLAEWTALLPHLSPGLQEVGTHCAVDLVFVGVHVC